MSSPTRLRAAVALAASILLLVPLLLPLVLTERASLCDPAELSSLSALLAALPAPPPRRDADAAALTDETAELDAAGAGGHHYALRLLVSDAATRALSVSPASNNSVGYAATAVDKDELLDGWARLVHALRTRTRDATRALELEPEPTFESSVVMHVPASLAKVSDVKSKLHRALSEFDVGTVLPTRESPAQRRVVHVAVVVPDPALPRNERQTVRVPSWGVVTFLPVDATETEETLWGFVRDVVLDASEDAVSGRSLPAKQATQLRALHRRVRVALASLRTTYELAESMPHMRVMPRVAEPFREAVALLGRALDANADDVTTRLTAANKAAWLAQQVAEDPSLVPQMYMSLENLFAVYSPFVLPVVLPLLAALRVEGKAWWVRRGRRRLLTVATESAEAEAAAEADKKTR